MESTETMDKGVLYLVPRPSPEAVSNVRMHDCDVHVVSDASQAQELIDAGRFSVGLVELDNCENETWHDEVRGCIDHGGLEWIALLSPRSLHDGELCRLIAEHCYAFHTLPADPQRLRMTIGHAQGMADVRQRALPDRGEVCAACNLLGASPPMDRVTRQIRRVASVDLPALLVGETGTGKELAARAIHDNSKRRDGPFVAINCAARPPNRIQSELFGDERGAFTGATQRKSGFVECAAGGTLLLDEIGDFPLELQAALLRFLQEGTICRVGGRVELPMDVRIISATHVDLRQAVARGEFRADLYFRLAVLEIDLPPLRDRPADVDMLAEQFLITFRGDRIGGPLRGFSRDALNALHAHDWPGNVRELKSRVQRAVVMCEQRAIMPRDLGLSSHVPRSRLKDLRQAREAAEEELVRRALLLTRYRVAEAARLLGVSHVTLYRLIKKYRIGLRRARDKPKDA